MIKGEAFGSYLEDVFVYVGGGWGWRRESMLGGGRVSRVVYEGGGGKLVGEYGGEERVGWRQG